VPEKIVIRCNQDCSDKPRTKDLQGSYTCKACFDKLQAAAQAKKAAPIGAGVKVPPRAPPVLSAAPQTQEADVLAALLDGPEVSTAPICPSCAGVLAEGSAVCLICGYNRATGQQVSTKQFAAPREKTSRGGGGAGGAMSFLTSPWVMFIGLTLLLGGTFFAGQEDQALMAIFMLTYLACAFATFIYEIVAAFADEDKGWGICAICQIVPCIGGICGLAMIYYVFAISERGRLKAMLGATLMGTIFYVIFAVQNPEMFNRGS
jgi:hypothetical protein